MKKSSLKAAFKCVPAITLYKMQSMFKLCKVFPTYNIEFEA